MIYGYARVSTSGQDLASQHEQLTAAGAEKIFAEKVSGAATDRRELGRLLKVLGAGDIVLVCKLDRLARSTRDLLNIIHSVAEAKASFKSLGDAWADTTSSHGRLMLTVLGGLAEFERDLIRARTFDGRKRALAKGVVMGRKPKLSQYQRQEACKRVAAGEYMVDVARSYGVNHSTISRLVHGGSNGIGCQ
jgi:DNA invertase Pin-like site-specific DNA recombinase